MTRTVKYTPAFAKATHLGLAIRAVDAAEMGACELQGPHPDSEPPLHYAEAIDPRTGRNWMDKPTTDSLPGTTPLYMLAASPILAAEWNLLPADTRADEQGYRPGEWYFVPVSWSPAEMPWPLVWDASAEPEAEAAPPQQEESTAGYDPLRRADIDRQTPTERAITEAMRAVEALAPDERLTHAVVALETARRHVADYVDGRPLVVSESLEDSATRKPPLGLVPREIVAAKRTQEILEAMHRYVTARMAIPVGWTAELVDLLAGLADVDRALSRVDLEAGLAVGAGLGARDPHPASGQEGA